MKHYKEGPQCLGSITFLTSVTEVNVENPAEVVQINVFICANPSYSCLLLVFGPGGYSQYFTRDSQPPPTASKSQVEAQLGLES